MTPDPNGCVTHREHDQAWTAHHREHIAHDREHALLHAEVDKTESHLDQRLAGMNEFRETLRDQASSFVSRDTLDARHQEIDRRIACIETWRSGMEGRIIGITAVIGFIVVLVSIGVRFI